MLYLATISPCTCTPPPPSQSGYTIIHAAVSGNLPDTLRMLLVHLRTSLERSEVIQVVNYTDKDGSTALHFAASRGYKVRIHDHRV